MKHLKTYNEHKNHDDLLMEGWLGDKMKQLSSGAKAALKGFVAPFQSVLKDIKQSWGDGVKAEEIKQKLISTFEKSFDEAEKNLANIEDEEEITKLINDMELSITQFSDTVTKTIQQSLKENVTFNEGKGDLMAAAAGVKAVFKTVSDTFGKLKADYLKEVEKQENIQQKKDVAQKQLDKMWDKIEDQITNLDIQKLMDDARAKGEQGDTTNDKEYEPGDSVKYTKEDGDENTATVAYSQEKAEEGTIRLQGEDGTRFNIQKDKILDSGNEEDASKESDDLKKKLGGLKDDRKKLKKISDFIDTL